MKGNMSGAEPEREKKEREQFVPRKNQVMLRPDVLVIFI